jgi:hypothetical protein
MENGFDDYHEILPKELKQANFRRGKWTSEEENYTSRIIKDFENGIYLYIHVYKCMYVNMFMYIVICINV